MSRPAQQINPARIPALALGALGVVYGDIGTSPLYTLKEVFSGSHTIPMVESNILGILSIIFWSLIIVVSLKYIVFVMSANNNGEGGIIALTALSLRGIRHQYKQYSLMMGLGILGAGLFYGDSVITPAISVMSAVEGLKVAAPKLHHLVTPLTLVVIVGLFFLQHKGTAIVGKLFGPIMLLWFFVIGSLGFVSIIKNPQVMVALNPYHAVLFFMANKWMGIVALGSTFLALTGAEALYADMGHFGRKPISISWFWLVLPALVLNYFGQGALLLHDQSAIINPFYLLAPNAMLYPLVALATVATIIASQAVISGTFSMTQEAIRLGYLPRIEIRYTSEEERGQIYIPTVNWVLFVTVVAVVLGFKTSDNLGAAYGLSVTGTMIITTCLAFIVIKRFWKNALWLLALIFGMFFIIDLAFLAGNLIKVKDGGWLPLFIASLVFIAMTTWRMGSSLLKHRIRDEAIPLDSFLHSTAEAEAIHVPGTAIFLTTDPLSVPRALICNLIHNKVLHERVVLLKVKIEDIPHVPPEEQVVMTHLEDNFHVMVVRYGFKDPFNIPQALEMCHSQGVDFSLMQTSFFMGKEALICGNIVNIPQWRKHLFIGMYRNASSFVGYFKIPYHRVIELGSKTEL